MSYRAEVDEDLCVGSGDCVQIAPEAFAIDERNGWAVTLPGLATTDDAAILQAGHACPMNAIRVLDQDGTVVFDSG